LDKLRYDPNNPIIMKNILLLSFIFFIAAEVIDAQDSCKVLVQNLQGKYVGECKKGLAHGQGTATGIDSYTGSFKKGFPDGHGKYIWSAGGIYEGSWNKGLRNGEGKYKYMDNGSEAIQDGIWKNDKYVGPKPVLPSIIQKINISNASFYRLSDGNSLTIKIVQNGMPASVTDLIMDANSGVQNISGSVATFKTIEFPFKCKITYKCWNSLKTVQYDCSLHFEIVQEGDWELRVEN
jgi:hypothetical protein